MLDPDDPDLQDELELACLDAMRGDPPGPAVATRLQRACIDVLRRRGVPSPVVRASSSMQGTSVQILLPTPQAKVRKLLLQLH